MIVVGLTGSIGMGKTTAAKALKRLGIPVHDADRAVHQLLAMNGAAVAPVSKAFSGAVPGLLKNGAIDREALGRLVFEDKQALRELEAVLHPLVRQSEERFLKRMASYRKQLVVLDIPLLFETGGENRCDATILVTAPPFLQEMRALKRPGMTRQRFQSIRTRQLPEWQKRQRADFIVMTGRDHGRTLHQLRRAVRLIAENDSRWKAGRRHY